MIIALIIAVIIALPLVLALFLKKVHYVKRAIVIDKPSQQIFDYVKLTQNQETFNECHGKYWS